MTGPIFLDRVMAAASILLWLVLALFCGLEIILSLGLAIAFVFGLEPPLPPSLVASHVTAIVILGALGGAIFFAMFIPACIRKMGADLRTLGIVARRP